MPETDTRTIVSTSPVKPGKMRPLCQPAFAPVPHFILTEPTAGIVLIPTGIESRISFPVICIVNAVIIIIELVIVGLIIIID